MRAKSFATLIFLFVPFCFTSTITTCEAGANGEPSNLGQVHMDISCSPKVSQTFDTGLALLHNFWYSRALFQFHQVIRADPDCAIAYWGAAMTYNHPYSDPPTEADEHEAWTLVQQGSQARNKSPREQMYLDAVGALFFNSGAGTKSDRDKAYMNAMASVYAKYPDDETKLFYALAILNTLEEGGDGPRGSNLRPI